MKSIFTLVLAIAAGTFSTQSLTAQCNAPSLTFHSPVLLSGINGQVGAVYNFAKVAPGLDAHVTVLDIIGGATLFNIDDSTGIGYYDAFQPYVGAAAKDTSFIDWRITFKKAGTNMDTMLTCLAVTGVDVDGDASALKEFIEAATPGSFAVDPFTNLSVSFDGVRSKAISPIANVALIDTNHREAMFQMNFSNITTLDYRNGAITTGGAQVRQTCIYFKSFFQTYFLLPARLLSFNAMSSKQTVELTWSATNEGTLKRHTIQKSENGKTWKNIGNIPALLQPGVNNYTLSDFSDINGRTYYRLMQVSADGSASYSSIVKVDPSSASPSFTNSTVFTNNIKITGVFEKSAEYKASVYSINGRMIAQKNYLSHAGTNLMSIDLPYGAGAGIYVLSIQNNAGQEVHKSKLIRVN
jgi:hypothetical protein